MASAATNEMLAAAAGACEDKKAEDIRILALDPAESGLTDYFLICTGSNNSQTVAITDAIELRLKREFGAYPNSVEGRRQGEWILMDYVDFIVHVFLPEKRAYYGLERLRPSATTLSIDDLNAELKAAITANRPKKSMKAAAKKVAAGQKTAARKVALKKEPAGVKVPVKGIPGLKTPAARKTATKKTTAAKSDSKATKTASKTASKTSV